MTGTVSADSESWIVQAWASATSAPSGPATKDESHELLQAEFILRTITQLHGCSDASDGCRVLANRLQQFLGCRQVAVGFRSRYRSRCQVSGISGAVQFDSHSRFMRAIQDALDETVVRDTATVWPPIDSQNRHASLAHEKLMSELGADRVVSGPLRSSDGRVIGVVLMVDEPADSALNLLDRYGELIASCLSLLSQTERGFFVRQMHRFWSTLHSWRGRVLWVGVACAALLLAVPMPYHIDCQCQVQPMKRRFVVAPYDGTLASSLVAPGDVVQQGDVLAQMDEREIRWELAGVKADWTRAKKQRDAAMASHRTSDSQLAKLEMERLDLQVRLLENRMENLAIKSPISGIVVTGDLEKAQGAPLTIGQTLFEVAPLDRMVVEVDLPEEEITHARSGMEVSVSLNALPDQLFSAPIRRIHPHAELRDHQSVFVSELEIDNSDGQLRPGMNGRARVTGGRHSLGWIIFHKPWLRVRRWFAW